MKKVILSLLLFCSTKAVAMKVTEQQLQTMPLCSIPQCQGTDGGQSFWNQCNFEARVAPYIDVLLKNFNAQVCYCPCTLEYLLGDGQ